MQVRWWWCMLYIYADERWWCIACITQNRCDLRNTKTASSFRWSCKQVFCICYYSHSLLWWWAKNNHQSRKEVFISTQLNMRVLYLKKSCISLFPSCEKHAVPCDRITQFCFIFIYLRCFLSFAETKQKAKFLLFNYHRSRNSSRELNGNADILKNVTYINFFVCSPLFLMTIKMSRHQHQQICFHEK